MIEINNPNYKQYKYIIRGDRFNKSLEKHHKNPNINIMKYNGKYHIFYDDNHIDIKNIDENEFYVLYVEDRHDKKSNIFRAEKLEAISMISNKIHKIDNLPNGNRKIYIKKDIIPGRPIKENSKEFAMIINIEKDKIKDFFDIEI